MASIIDAFLVTLGLDTTNFKKGVDEAEEGQKQTRESADKTAEHLKEKGKNAGEFFTELIAKAGEFLGIMMSVEALKSFAEGELEAEDAGVKLARMMDINVQELQGWQRAVQLEGGSAQDFNASLRQTTSNLALIAIHGPRAQMALRLFAGLGLHEADLKGKNAIQVFEMLSEKMKGMSGGTALGLGMRLGLSEGTIRLLMKGKEGVAELVEEEKRLGTYTEEQAGKAEEFNDTMENVKIQFAMVGKEVIHSLMPALQGFANILIAIGDWAKKHPVVIKAAIAGITAAVMALSVAMAPVVLELLPIELITLAIAAAVGLVAAAVTYLYLEWKKWMDGGKSSLGGFFQFFADVWNGIKGAVMSTLEFLKETFTQAIQVLKDSVMFFYYMWTGQWGKAIDKFKELFKDFKTYFTTLFKMLYYEFYLQVYSMENVWNEAWRGMQEGAVRALLHVIEMIKKFGPVGDLLVPGLSSPALQHAFAGYSGASAGEATPGGFRSMSSHSTTTKSVSIGTIYVNTQATDAGGVAAALGPAIKSHDLVDQADGGI